MQSQTPISLAQQRKREATGGFTFLREAVRDMRAVGAVAPSSTALATALVAPVRLHDARPLSVLEVGAGTGPATRLLLPFIGPGDRLDIVEPNSRFAQHLRALVAASPAPEAVRVHETVVQQLDTEHRYDVIVSGLPLTNFDPTVVAAIMDRFLELLRPGGSLTYFSYRGTRTARALLSSRAETARHRAVQQLVGAYQQRYGHSRTRIWRNLPPATVSQLRAPIDQVAPVTPDRSPQAATCPAPTTRAQQPKR